MDDWTLQYDADGSEFDLEPPRTISVGDLTESIKMLLEGTFGDVWVEGEITDVTRARSGHIYCTIKDDRSVIRGVIWRGTAAKIERSLGSSIRGGQSVLCRGDVEVYAPRGQYQLIIRDIRQRGLGDLQMRFERLRALLDAEGLFSAARKRPLPMYPKRIAVVTSPSGAAIRDFLESATRRWSGVDIVVIPALVQGPTAAASIAAAIEAAGHMRPRIDTLVVTRGGGSLEDLWCFNEEIVVRAIAATTIPVVSGVGHEIDVTLADLVADIRALTPTDAASRVLPDRDSARLSVDELGNRLHRLLQSRIEFARNELASIADRPVFRRPLDMVHDRVRELDDLSATMDGEIWDRWHDNRSRMERFAAALHALSPLEVLGRGYSVTTTDDGTVVRDADALDAGQMLVTRFESGSCRSIVTPASDDSQ